MKIRVYIVDDHQLFIDGLKAILKNVEDIKVVGEATCGKDCLIDLEKMEVDVLVTDISMPEMKGDELVTLVKHRYPAINVLTLSMHYDYSFIDKMIQVGSLGYVLKNTGSSELQEAIRYVNDGKSYYSVKVQESIVNGYSKEKVKQFKSVVFSDEDIFLTPREKEVVKLVIKGYNSSEIAEIMNVSYHTITSHRKNVNAKLGTNSLTELANIVKEKGLL